MVAFKSLPLVPPVLRTSSSSRFRSGDSFEPAGDRLELGLTRTAGADSRFAATSDATYGRRGKRLVELVEFNLEAALPGAAPLGERRCPRR